jgi:DNA-binding MarR family transcriptional regulator
MSTPKPPPREILDPFLRVVADLIVFNQEVADRLGVGTTDMQVVGHIQREGGAMTPGRLAELTGLSTGTITGLIDRLEKAGYVRRERDPNDRRRVLLHVDEARLQQEIAPLYAAQGALLAEVVDRFSPAEQATIAAFLDALVPDRR